MAISKSVKSASGNSFVWFDQTREEATIAEWQVWFNGDSEEKDFVVSVDFFIRNYFFSIWEKIALDGKLTFPTLNLSS